MIGDDRTVDDVHQGDDGCVELLDTSCVKPADACGQRAADLVVDSRGKLVDYLCYPDAATWTVDHLQAQDGDIAQRDNNAVLVLDDLDDGADIVGSVDIDANNVVIYGSTPDTAVLAGDLSIDGNNALIRGLRIRGDVTVLKNDATLAFCVIEGNLTIEGNNAKLLACDVLGAIIVKGNGAQLVGNHVAGGISGSSKHLVCSDNFAANDLNGDLRIAPTELAQALSCD